MKTRLALSFLVAFTASLSAQRSAIMSGNRGYTTQYYLDLADSDSRREIDASRANLATNISWQILPPDNFKLVVRRASENGILCDLAVLDPDAGVFVHERYIILTNYPMAATTISGTPLNHIRARRIGRSDVGGETSAVYDCVPPNPHNPPPRELSPSEKLAVQILAENRKAAADAATLKFHLERAQAGNESSQRRLVDLYTQRADTNAAAAWQVAATTNSPAGSR